jgi:hypothetical protein
MMAILLMGWLRLLRIMALIVMMIVVGIWLFREHHRSTTATSTSIGADADRLTHFSTKLLKIFKILYEKRLWQLEEIKKKI